MSFFKKLRSGLKSFAIKAVKYAGKALSKFATVGEKVIKKVKDTWPKIKPWLEKYSTKLSVIPYVGPYLAAAATGLLALDKSPILRTVGSLAEKWLPIVGRIGEKLKDWAEIKEAEAARQKVEEAELEKISNRQREELLVYKILLHHKILVSKVAEKIKENDVSDMESYLQLRAAGRILEQMQKRWSAHELRATDFTSDDAFVLAFTDKLLIGQEVSDAEADKFGEIVESMFGRPIFAIVFDEMVKQWSADLVLDRKRVEEIMKQRSHLEDEKKDLEFIRDFEQLDATRESRYNRIQEELKVVTENEKDLKASINHRQYYIEAAEGMLLVYEGDDALKSALEGRGDLSNLIEAIKERTETAANVILQCMEGEKEWESLTEEEKNYILDFSNVFRTAAENRAKPIVEVVVGAA